jgi:hypothetical protein
MSVGGFVDYPYCTSEIFISHQELDVACISRRTHHTVEIIRATGTGVHLYIYHQLFLARQLGRWYVVHRSEEERSSLPAPR